MSRIKLDDMLERQSAHPFQKIVDETVIVETRAKRMHALNDVASYIWQLLEKPHTVKGIINKVIEQYDIDTKSASRDVLTFINQLKDRNLIKGKIP